MYFLVPLRISSQLQEVQPLWIGAPIIPSWLLFRPSHGEEPSVLITLEFFILCIFIVPFQTNIAVWADLFRFVVFETYLDGYRCKFKEDIYRYAVYKEICQATSRRMSVMSF